MLFVCGWPAYRGVPVTLIYALSKTPDQQLQQSVRFGADGQLQRLTKIQTEMTSDWLAANNITASECITSDNTDLASVQRQQPVCGNFTQHTFNRAGTYEVQF